MVTYRVDVRPILEETGASVEIDDSVELDVLRVGDEVFSLRRPATVRVSVTNAGAGIVAHGSIEADVKATCSRCLCEFDDVIRGEVIGFYTREEDQAQEEDEAEQIDSEGSIDLGPALMAALVIEAPFAPLHDQECAGLCSTCGADLNAGPCDCHAQPADSHPFGELGVLLGESGAKPDSAPDHDSD